MQLSSFSFAIPLHFYIYGVLHADRQLNVGPFLTCPTYIMHYTFSQPLPKGL